MAQQNKPAQYSELGIDNMLYHIRLHPVANGSYFYACVVISKTDIHTLEQKFPSSRAEDVIRHLENAAEYLRTIPAGVIESRTKSFYPQSE